MFSPDALFNHLVLPPKLPTCCDEDLETLQRAICGRLFRASHTLSNNQPPDTPAIWESVRTSIRSCRDLNQGRLDKHALINAFAGLEPNQHLYLYVVQQNAGLIVRRDTSQDLDVVVFEAFEASASSESVLAAEGAMEWSFPGRAAQIPHSTFSNSSFQQNLATRLEQASSEALDCFSARTTKAKVSVSEDRDTASPAFITQWLMPVIEASGSPAKTSRLLKRVRDDVNFDNAALPWRRLPFWLVMRVGLQRQLCFSQGPELGRGYYKVLIATMLSQFLSDFCGTLAPDQSCILRGKLSRRMAKIQGLLTHETISSSIPLCRQIDVVADLVKKSLSKATNSIDQAYDDFKRETKRAIPCLAPGVSDESLKFDLTNSHKYLRGVIKTASAPTPSPAVVPSGLPQLHDGMSKKVSEYAKSIYAICTLEDNIQSIAPNSVVSTSVSAARCLMLRDMLDNYSSAVKEVYHNDTEQMSLAILNKFALWIQMDRHAVNCCPLLREYKPAFDAESLDALQLNLSVQSQRLHDIQTYLATRHQESKFDYAILSPKGADSFATQYVKASSHHLGLKRKILAASEASKDRVESAWNAFSEEFDDLSAKIATETCECRTDKYGEKDVRGCSKCFHYRVRRRLEITAHEDYLPPDEHEQNLILLELDMPSYLRAYREATWSLVQLGNLACVKGDLPKCTLNESQLRPYSTGITNGLTLASHKKPFSKTHYKHMRTKVALSEVLRPFGLEFEYYDQNLQHCLGSATIAANFHHLSGLRVPKILQHLFSKHDLKSPEGLPSRSSYDIVASSTKCPSTVALHEYLALQKLMLGSSQFWINLLRELGSCNLNFSDDETVTFITHLADKSGPRGDENCVQRLKDQVFGDEHFCKQLVTQIGRRLNDIHSNWRETNCMELLIHLSLRLFAFGTFQGRILGKELIQQAREATLGWIVSLRREIRSAKDSGSAETATKYGLTAALLCRRTFATFVISEELQMCSKDVFTFITASLALRENTVVEPKKLSPLLRAMTLRDLKMAYKMAPVVKKGLKCNILSLEHSLECYWDDDESHTGRSYSSWTFLPDENWIVATLNFESEHWMTSQTLHYNFLEGHLLIDGRPLEALPLEIQDSPHVKALFEDQHLLTYPSKLKGMTHRLHYTFHGQSIHFGIRKGRVIIQAVQSRNVWEFIPADKFGTHRGCDLPSSLIEDCVHWLDVNHRVLEIRPKEERWTSNSRFWRLDLTSNRIQRNGDVLVNPHSGLCRDIGQIIGHFEEIYNMTVYKPLHEPLRVDLKHLELSFFVNRSGLLQCRELPVEIDTDQDAGTFYGLQSMIVVRDIANKQRRSVLVTLGPPVYVPEGAHVLVQTRVGCNRYGKFDIDFDLRRLSCPPVPELLFSKALLHAVTAMPVPDSLTGRTGTEEAFHTLQSAKCQPWTPFPEMVKLILKYIGNLSPSREYYPKEKRKLQTTNWNINLTTFIQHDGYYCLTQTLLEKSQRLLAFEPGSVGITAPLSISPCLSQLQKRGVLQRNLYSQMLNPLPNAIEAERFVYRSRDQKLDLPQATMVFQSVRSILSPQCDVDMKKSLCELLEEWEHIGGLKDSKGLTCWSLADSIEADLHLHFVSLVNFAQTATEWDLIFQLTTLLMRSSSRVKVKQILQLVVAFYKLPALRVMRLPRDPCFSGFHFEEKPTMSGLLKFLEDEYPSFAQSSNGSDSSHTDSDCSCDCDNEVEHDAACHADGEAFAALILEQWPAAKFEIGAFEASHLDAEFLETCVQSEWQRLIANWHLSKFVSDAQQALNVARPSNLTQSSGLTTPAVEWNSDILVWNSKCAPLTIPDISNLLWKSCHYESEEVDSDELLQNFHEKYNRYPNTGIAVEYPPERQIIPEIEELSSLLQSFETSTAGLGQTYAHDLMASLNAYRTSLHQPQYLTPLPDIQFVKDMVRAHRVHLSRQIAKIHGALLADEPCLLWLSLGNILPSMTPVKLLEQLRSLYNHKFGPGMKDQFLDFATSLTALQRLLRIEQAHLMGDNTKCIQECQNLGHENWAASEFCDWLLLEIDNDMLIRKEQVDVAHAIISPASNSNSLLQMNMGKGKTSCIMPMAAAVLANKKQLCRLVVPKPLLNQTAEILQSRLGGLVGREICHVHYSRQTPNNSHMLQLYPKLNYEVLKSGGVLVTTPEILLSYQLSGKQNLVDGKTVEARKMQSSQLWLEKFSRDILDESDITLAVKTQLIYPSGAQLSVDGHPHRWEIPQLLLSLVEENLNTIQTRYPQSIEIVDRAKGFPLMIFLDSDVEDALCKLLIKDICAGRWHIFRKILSSRLSDVAVQRKTNSAELDVQLDMQSFLENKAFNTEAFERLLLRAGAEEDSVRTSLLILRGLLTEGILMICLKKRWGVQYGLHLARQPMAVPYEAKGVPSERAEFGHPDVAIVLTCLAFLYTGLDIRQLSDGLNLVLRSDDPSTEYNRWIESAFGLPPGLRHWNVINVDDRTQITQLWNHLRLDRNVISHYLRHFVFPVHAKQFPVKLQASGWDLPLFPENHTGARTTGFSGTNDNKILLPLNIQQDDLPGLQQTSAEVLTYLLQPRNRQFQCAVTRSNNKRYSESDLLRRLKDLGIRLLIDAGAYILEMSNEAVVTEWLEIDRMAQAAVYFDNQNQAWVRYRGRKAPIALLATPFVNNLKDCVVYLDQAHTRGVDLKFSPETTGAVTLALGQTKDHTVQAAMRLRQLSNNQNILFIGPPEVKKSIEGSCNLGAKDTIDSSHVITWLLHQTCRANKQLRPLYIAQGTDFCSRKDAEWAYFRSNRDTRNQKEYVSVIRQPERQSLVDLYSPHLLSEPKPSNGVRHEVLKRFLQVLESQGKMLEPNVGSTQSSAFEEVEQEREVEFQVEEVREVQRPAHFKALSFPGLHPEIKIFVETGTLYGKEGHRQIFEFLRDTKVGTKFEVVPTQSRLFISAEFARTVEETKCENVKDAFLRPVEWIVWSPSSQSALIVIPEEAEKIITMIRKSFKPNVFLIVYAAPIAKTMSHFNGLSFYTIPRLPDHFVVPKWLSIELGIFAGRTFLNHAECAAISDYIKGAVSTFFKRRKVMPGALGTYFTTRPVEFLVEWLPLRRRGQNMAHTPLGYICQGREMSADHPFFNNPEEAETKTTVPSVGNGVGDSLQTESIEGEDGDEVDEEVESAGQVTRKGEKIDEGISMGSEMGEEA